MKKLYLLAALIIITVAANAQSVGVYFKNGTKVEFDKSLVDSIKFLPKASEPTVTEGDAIDLGLSVKWASCNVGATSPEGAGNYYAWGETSTKYSSDYKESFYAYYNSSTTVYTNIGTDISGTAYDAATVNIGKGWRMPTTGEVEELINKCTWTWTQINGKNGYKVVATNGKSIFLPACGTQYSWGIEDFGRDLGYWTSNIADPIDYIAYYLCGSSTTSYVSPFGKRYLGLPIRPVISY